MADDTSNGMPMFDMFRNFGKDLKLPGPDIESVMDFHRKNLKAWQEVIHTSSEGTQKAMALQRAQLEDMMAQMAQMVESYGKGDASDAMSRQMEMARKAFETTVSNTAQMGEIARESGTQSFEILKKRMEESLAEMRSAMGGKG